VLEVLVVVQVIEVLASAIEYGLDGLRKVSVYRYFFKDQVCAHIACNKDMYAVMHVLYNQGKL